MSIQIEQVMSNAVRDIKEADINNKKVFSSRFICEVKS